MNRHSRKDAGQKTGQHIPEEVLHGHNLLSEDVPTARNLYQNITPIKAGLGKSPAFFCCSTDSGIVRHRLEQQLFSWRSSHAQTSRRMHSVCGEHGRLHGGLLPVGRLIDVYTSLKRTTR